MLLSVMFSTTLLQKIVFILGSIFLRPIWRDNVNFMLAFFYQIAEIPQGRALEWTPPKCQETDFPCVLLHMFVS